MKKVEWLKGQQLIHVKTERRWMKGILHPQKYLYDRRVGRRVTRERQLLKDRLPPRRFAAMLLRYKIREQNKLPF